MFRRCLFVLALGSVLIDSCAADNAPVRTNNSSAGGSPSSATAGGAGAQSTQGNAGVAGSVAAGAQGGGNPAVGGTGGSLAHAGEGGQAEVAPACNADPGHALQFRGTGDDRVHADITKLPVGRESRTIELWAYFDGTDVSWINERGLFEYGFKDGDATYPGGGCHELGVNSLNWPQDREVGRIHPYGNCGSVDEEFELPAGTPRVGWLHFALGYDGPNNQFQFTINGVKMVGLRHPDQWQAEAGWNSTKSPLRIGTTDEFAGPPGWQGKIDELRVWNVFRSEAEIKRDMKVMLKGNEPGLVAYYKFDEGTGQSSADATGDAANAAKFVGADQASAPMWVKSDIPGPFRCPP